MQVKYPDNLELRKNLEKGDQVKIAKATGYTLGYINMIFTGRRKLPDRIRKAYDVLLKLKADMDRAMHPDNFSGKRYERS